MLFFSPFILLGDVLFSWQKIRCNAFKKSQIGRLAFFSAAHVESVSVFLESLSAFLSWLVGFSSCVWVSVNASLCWYTIICALALARLDCSNGGLAFLTRKQVKYMRYLIRDCECFKLDEGEFPFIFQADTSQRFESQEYIFEK